MSPPRLDTTTRRRATGAALVLLAALVAAACGSYSRPQAAPATTSTTTTARPGAPTTSTTTTVPGGPTAPPTTSPRADEVSGLPGRLAVITADGTLVVMAPDGTGRLTIAQPADGVITQPTWSRDGSRLAFTATGDTAAAVRIVTADARTTIEQAVTPGPTLFAWSPDDARLAVERPVDAAGAPTVGIDLLAATADASPRRVASDATTALAWEPNGQRLVVRAGDALSVVAPDGTARALGLVAGTFSGPAWVSGNRVLVAAEATTGSVLTLVDADSGARTDLLRYEGTLDLVVDPAGTRVAFRVVQSPSGGGDDRLTAFARSATSSTAPTPTTPSPTTTAPLPTATPEVLAVMDLRAGATPRVVSPDPVEAFSWSPTGDRLGFLTATGPSTGLWAFWDGTKTLSSSRYAPSTPVLGQYLRDFAEYAATVTTWSPDGSAFVYAGLVANQEGIWIQRIADPMPGPVRVSDGAIALWSPR